MPAWRIYAGSAAIKPLGLISSGVGRWDAFTMLWAGRRIVCAPSIVTGLSRGFSRILRFLPVLFFQVTLPGPAVWTTSAHLPLGCMSMETDHCFGISMPAKPLRS